jgi:pimeloyl-ACP methyl ester carboxylesterase
VDVSDGDRGGHLWDKDREAVSSDGTTIRYTVRGPEAGPHVILCAGYLCPDNFWWHLAPELARTYRVVLLNYRGVGGSGHPREPGFLGRNLRAMDYAMANLAADVRAVMDAEAITSAPVVGHSMGCQVALELYRSDDHRVDALVLVTGPFTSPLESFYDSEVGARVFPLVYRLGKIVPEPLWRLVPALGHLPGGLEVQLWFWHSPLHRGPRLPPRRILGGCYGLLPHRQRSTHLGVRYMRNGSVRT